MAKSIFIGLLLGLLAGLAPGNGYAANGTSIEFGLKPIDEPASDLLYNGGSPVDPFQLKKLRSKGLDLSTLDPPSNDLWQSAPLPLDDRADYAYPEDGATVTYDSLMETTDENVRLRVDSTDGTQLNHYMVQFSLRVHGGIAMSAFLRKLGYKTPFSKHYNRLTIRFPDLDTRKLFLTELEHETAARKRWIVDQPENDPILVVRDIALEPGHIKIARYQWGSVVRNDIRGQRAMRAMLVPLSLFEIPESLNLYSPELGKSHGDNITLDQLSAAAFRNQIGGEDARWIAKKIAALTREDFKQFLDMAEFPAPELVRLALEKTIARRNHLMKMLGIKVPDLPYNLVFSEGGVEDGKQVKEYYDDCVTRYRREDPKQPITLKGVGQIFTIEAIDAMITKGLSYVNERIQIRTTGEAYAKHQMNMLEKLFNHYISNPTQPYEEKFHFWAQPIAGFSIGMGRHVVTGSYYGSAAPLQQVDSFSVNFQVGIVGGFEGVSRKFPITVGANIIAGRTYAHIRPVENVKEALDSDWTKLGVPLSMSNMAHILADKPPMEDPDHPPPKEWVQKKQLTNKQRIETFLKGLRKDELFTITDTIGLTGQLKIQIPFYALMPNIPIRPNEFISVGPEGSFMIVRRMTFYKTQDGFQIYVQKSETLAGGIGLDVNYWMRIMKASAEKKKTWNSRTFVVEVPDVEEMKEEEAGYWVGDLRRVFRTNSTRDLPNHTPAARLFHDFESENFAGRILFWNWGIFHEKHQAKALPYPIKDDPDKPEDQATILYSDKYLSRTGNNYYVVLTDALSVATDGAVVLNGETSGSNPAYSLMGNAHWVTLKTEGNITQPEKPQMLSSVEEIWAGWFLFKSGWMDLLEKAQKQFDKLGLPIPPIRKEAFTTTKYMQLYSLKTRFVVYQNGLERMQNFLSNKGTEPFFSASSLIGRFSQWVTGKDEYTATDREVVKHLIQLGGGKKFEDYCWQEAHPARGGSKTAQIYYGNSYDCIAPWMVKVLAMRRSYPFGKGGEQVSWMNEFFKLTYEQADFKAFLDWIGPKNFFLGIMTGGFRIKDENGDEPYYSDSVGTGGKYATGGLFDEYAKDNSLTQYEVDATYLSEAN